MTSHIQGMRRYIINVLVVLSLFINIIQPQHYLIDVNDDKKIQDVAEGQEDHDENHDDDDSGTVGHSTETQAEDTGGKS